MPSGALGDTVLQLRIAEAMRRALPAARITWLGRDGWLPLAQRCPAVDEALGLDALGTHRLFEPGLHTDPDLADRLSRFDVIVNGLSGPDSPVMARLRRFARGSAVCYDTRPQTGATGHVCRQWLGQIASQWVEPFPAIAGRAEQYAQTLNDPCDILLRPQTCDQDVTGVRFPGTSSDPPQRRVLLHPGSGGLHKCWPIEHYVHLREILQQRGCQSIVLLGPAELERWPEQADRLARNGPVIVDPSLAELVWLAHLASAYVGNDSGPTHVAAAAGTPTLALFGPTEPRLWGPLGPAVRVLSSQQHQHHWTDLSAETVAREVATFLR